MIDDGTLKVIRPDFDREPAHILEYGVNILELECEMDARSQFQKITARVWDSSKQALSTAQAKEPLIKEAGNLTSVKLAKFAGLDHFTLQHGGQMTNTELQTWADAELQCSRLSKIVGRAKVVGRASVKPGSTVVVKGIGERFSGQLWVSGVKHVIENGNWESEIQFGLPHGEFSKKYGKAGNRVDSCYASTNQGHQIGIVTQLQDDPEGEFRVQVKMPLMDLQGAYIWARVVSPDAGSDRGFFFRPEIGDEVVLGFLGSNPGDALLIGSLHSSAVPTPFMPTDENPIKGYVSRDGVKVVLNDELQSMTVETPHGNRLSLSDNDREVEITDQNGNKIKLSTSGIDISSVIT